MKIAYIIFFILIYPSTLMADAYTLKSVKLTSAEYPPYYSKTLKNQGPVSEIIRTAFFNVGYTVQIDFYTWARSEFFAQKGIEYDGMFPPWHTKQRESFFIFSQPLFDNIIGLYKHKMDDIKFSDYADINHLSVGTVTGYANPRGFDEAKFQKYFVSNDARNIQMLCKRRVDLIIIDKLSAQYILTKQFPECSNIIEWIEPELEFKAQHLVISLKTDNATEIIKDFNRGLQQLKNSGDMKKILIKHGIYKALLQTESIEE